MTILSGTLPDASLRALTVAALASSLSACMTTAPTTRVDLPVPESRIEIALSPPRTVTVMATTGDSIAVPDIAAIDARLLGGVADTLWIVVEDMRDASGRGLTTNGGPRDAAVLRPRAGRVATVREPGTLVKGAWGIVVSDGGTVVRRYERRLAPIRTAALVFVLGMLLYLAPPPVGHGQL